MVKKKIDKRNNPNLGLFKNAKGVFESPLDTPVIVNGKEMTVIEILDKQAKQIDKLQQIAAVQTEQISVLIAKFNEAIKGINHLSERLEALEADYNPLNK